MIGHGEELIAHGGREGIDVRDRIWLSTVSTADVDPHLPGVHSHERPDYNARIIVTAVGAAEGRAGDDASRDKGGASRQSRQFPGCEQCDLVPR